MIAIHTYRSPLYAAAFMAMFPVACGGETVGSTGSTQSSTSTRASSSSSSRSSTSEQSSSTETSSRSSSSCIQTQLEPGDTACASDLDCAVVYIGQVCPNDCAGCDGNAAANVAAASRLSDQESAVDSSSGTSTVCSCPPPEFNARCIGGQCTPCAAGIAGATPGCGDAG